MTQSEISDLLKQKVHVDAVVPESDAAQAWIELQQEYLLACADVLRSDSELYFDHLACLSGVDLPEQNKIGIVLHLYSYPFEHKVVIKYFTERKTPPLLLNNQIDKTQFPIFPSVSGIWKTAIWHEREAFDLFGIWFENHPDLRRILLPPDWEGFPLRKDYTLAEKYHDIQIEY